MTGDAGGEQLHLDQNDAAEHANCKPLMWKRASGAHL